MDVVWQKHASITLSRSDYSVNHSKLHYRSMHGNLILALKRIRMFIYYLFIIASVLAILPEGKE